MLCRFARAVVGAVWPKKCKARHSRASVLKDTSNKEPVPVPHPDGGRPEEGEACESLRLSPCVLVQPDGWALGEREGYGGPCDVTSLSLSLSEISPGQLAL